MLTFLCCPATFFCTRVQYAEMLPILKSRKAMAVVNALEAESNDPSQYCPTAASQRLSASLVACRSWILALSTAIEPINKTERQVQNTASKMRRFCHRGESVGVCMMRWSPNVKAVYPPCPDAQTSRRFVWGTGAWRIHCG